MASKNHIARLRQGALSWNRWRDSSRVRPDLRDWNFEETHPTRGRLDFHRDFDDFNFAGADLHGISARNLIFCGCKFDDCSIDFADLCFSGFFNCSFRGASLRVTKVGSACFSRCDFTGADLGYCSAEETSFEGSRMHDCSLQNTSLVNVDFSRADLRNVRVYGVSAWDLKLVRTKQQDILVGPDERASITVDNIELAQFIHLLVRNSRIRGVIDTIVSKVVLLLGRFTPERKQVINSLRRSLRERNYIPVVFDFTGPKGRNLTETVRTLAHLARFVIVDLTEPKSVPHELANIVPSLPSVPFQPIIAEGHSPFGMFHDYKSYPWILPVRKYSGRDLPAVTEQIVAACERRLHKKA